ncbi:MAG: L-erythro-3,5-diaminohexanoate dehydrogenase [Candidatus Izemoplasmatales bacterium]|jgi:L-erythro-3,5-diaminohexanoate dehydrogenase|nr:L-erythro-3,5-diaminohexanoate dehydrogenase [Candidatus Izemoplasmatales bacterium]
MKTLCPYGTHRVIKPLGVLPQAAEIINNEMNCEANEILIDVKTLNIDSASFHQIYHSCDGDALRMKTRIMEIVNTRGKMQNPVTGSGGMLLGTIKQIGENLHTNVVLGDEIATLVSLSLTPLKIEKIVAIHMDSDQVDIIGQAILFETGIYAKIPTDLDKILVLSALDVCGAPAQVARLVKPNDSVLILGAGGKSGLLCTYQAKKNAGPNGKVIGVINDVSQYEDLKAIQACDEIIIGDARNPLEIYHKVLKVNNGQQVDVTFNNVNVNDTEMTSILPTKNSGIVYFFSMATSFTKAALGAEGVASEATLMIGNGYTSGHADLTLNLLRESRLLYAIFMRRYGPRG